MEGGQGFQEASKILSVISLLANNTCFILPLILKYKLDLS